MKEINTQKGIFYFVLVPDDATNFKFNEDSFSKIIMFETQNGIDSVEITKEKYEIISTTKDITEEQYELICPDYYFHTKDGDDLYYNFIKKEFIYDSNFKESLQSLLQANGLNEPNYLILKKL